jgi:hypothetical protein
VDWRSRERLLYWGAPLAIVPALVFLPAFVALVFAPRVSHAIVWSAVLFPVLLVAEVAGIWKLARGCVEPPFTLLTMLSFGAMLVVLVIATYTGVFLVALIERM